MLKFHVQMEFVNNWQRRRCKTQWVYLYYGNSKC